MQWEIYVTICFVIQSCRCKCSMYSISRLSNIPLIVVGWLSNSKINRKQKRWVILYLCTHFTNTISTLNKTRVYLQKIISDRPFYGQSLVYKGIAGKWNRLVEHVSRKKYHMTHFKVMQSHASELYDKDFRIVFENTTLNSFADLTAHVCFDTIPKMDLVRLK